MIPVIGCVGDTSTVRAVRKVKAFERTGISYLAVLPPFYYSTAQEHLLRFFSEIAAATDLPLLLYDNPVMTKNRIFPEIVAELRCRIPSLVGVKKSNKDCVNLQYLLEVMHDVDGFSVLTGSEFIVVVGLEMGCAGAVGGLHNLCPHLAVELYKSFRQGNLEAARQCQRDLIKVWQIFKYEYLGSF